jgi:predicted peptidase
MNQRKIIFKILSMGMVLLITLGITGDAFAKSTVPSYRTITEIYDWGAAMPKIIVDLGKDVEAGAVAKDTFKVYVKRSVPAVAASDQAKDMYTKLSPSVGDTKILGDTEGYREIVNVYVADKDGNAAKSSRYVVIEMKVGPTLTLGSPLNFDIKTMHNDWVQCDYTITQVKSIAAKKGYISGLVVTKSTGNTTPIVDDFTFSEETNDGITMKYASFEPAKDNKKNPLIIWLHGMGEGGNDPTIPISANKANMFAAEKIQSHFGGSYVLVPQAPTFWMDGFTGKGDGTSKYEVSLMALIKNYVANHKDIDTNRIYIGGDSNGGYMTMLMIRDYPDYFAAAFPTCEALRDDLITGSDIQKMKKIPIWFTAAKTDGVVPPAEYVVPTHKRLLSAGAKNVQFSFFDDVHDSTGLYQKEDKTPFEYNGHWSWIYVYNNECISTIDGRQVTLMEWLAAQHK